jgi:hypothetical protein
MAAVEAAKPSRTRRYEYAAIYVHSISLHFIVNASIERLNIKAAQHVIAITHVRAAVDNASNIDDTINQDHTVVTRIDGCSCAALDIGNLWEGRA